MLKIEFKEEIAKRTLTIITEDIRNFRPESSDLRAGEYVLAANIPYYITGEIIRQFLTTDTQPRAIALLIQREVADRIVARNSEDPFAFGQSADTELSQSALYFNPPPSVDSAILLTEFKNICRYARRCIFQLAGFASKENSLQVISRTYFQRGGRALADCGLSERFEQKMSSRNGKC